MKPPGRSIASHLSFPRAAGRRGNSRGPWAIRFQAFARENTLQPFADPPSFSREIRSIDRPSDPAGNIGGRVVNRWGGKEKKKRGEIRSQIICQFLSGGEIPCRDNDCYMGGGGGGKRVQTLIFQRVCKRAERYCFRARRRSL